MKKLLIVMLMTIYGMIFAQQAEEPAGNDQAMVRVAHLDPDTPELEISVDGESSFEVVAFRAVSDYQPVSSGTVNITVLVEGEEVASDSHDFEAGRHYTLVVLSGVAEAVEDAVEEETETVEEPEETPAEAAEEVGEEVPEEEAETVEEPEETPEEAAEEVGEEVPEEEAETVEEVEQGLRVLIFTDEALVRVLHAYSPADDETREEGVDFAPFSPEQEEVQEAVREVVLGVSFGQVSNYFPVAADAGFEIRLVESGEVVAEAEAGQFEQGRIYTVILTVDEAGLPDIIIQEDDLMVEEEAESTAEGSEVGEDEVEEEAESTAEGSEVGEDEGEAAEMETHSWTGNEEFTTETFEVSGEWEIMLGAWCYDGISFVTVTAFDQDGEEAGEVTVIGQGTQSGILDTEPGTYYLEVTSPDMNVYHWELVVQQVGTD